VISLRILEIDLDKKSKQRIYFVNVSK